MKREILFRGKRIDNGEWVYGDLITAPIHHECVIQESGCINHAVLPATVGQYIGISDKNDLRVFEGDLMLDKENRTWLIAWNNKQAKFVIQLQEIKKKFDGRIGPMQTGAQEYLLKEMQFIGNIHETASEPNK